MAVICFIELGSNERSDRTIRDALRALRECFPDIAFSRMLTTEPQNFLSPRPFLNLTGRFTTLKTEEEVRRTLKAIERRLGRKPEDKMQGRIRIDIDLLMYGGIALKAQDLQRDYVRAGLSELNGQPLQAGSAVCFSHSNISSIPTVSSAGASSVKEEAQGSKPSGMSNFSASE